MHVDGKMTAQFLVIVILILALATQASYYYLASPLNAYTWDKAYPQSCECAESSVGDQTCNLFKCSCVCDVTAGICDYGCCCDPDCSADQISRFNDLNSCTFEGSSSSDSITFCYTSSELYGVNPKAPMGGTPSASEGLNRALCVEKKNYAFPSQYFTNDELQSSSSVFGTSAGTKSFSYTDDNSISTVDVSIDRYYDQNDTIAAFFSSSKTSSGFVSNGAGFFQLPQNDFSGHCNDDNYIGFEVNVRSPKSCSRRMDASSTPSFQLQCEGEQSLQRYVTDLYVARTAEIQASSGVSSSADVAKVQLRSVFYFDSVLSTKTDVTGDFQANSCDTKLFDDVSSSIGFSDSCLFTSSASWTAIEALKNSTADPIMLCSNIVRDVVYYVNHSADARASIQSVWADVVVTDLAVALSSGEASLTQSFGVEFASANTAARSSSNGNLVTRVKSGNPGYQQGLPVLLGYRNGSVIAETIEGFTVPYASKGSCPRNDDAVEQFVTAFGYDTLSGCTLTLKRDDLRDFCCTGASGACLAHSFVSQVAAPSVYVDPATGLAHFLNVSQISTSGVSVGYVGIYGDADPLDISQWFPYATSFPTDARTWNDETSTCSKVFAGLSIQFLVANSADRENPQKKIVAAKVEVVTSDWVFSVPPSNQNGTQTFQLSIVTSYVPLQEYELQDYIPPPPPALFKLPYDVFYPFTDPATNDASSSPFGSSLARSSLLSIVSVAILASASLIAFISG